MKNKLLLLMIMLNLDIFGALTITNCSNMPKKPITNAQSSWSAPINGLSGRLQIEFEDLKPGLRHAVYLELKNQSVDPLAVINQPEIRAELTDSSGKSVSTTSLPMSGPIPRPQWAVIPRDAYIGLRIDMQTVGLPTREHGVVLLAVGGKSWQLKAGKYELRAALTYKNEKDGPQNQWIGELDLPPVDVVVTKQMIAVN